MTRSSGKAHIIRAAVESIAYQIRDCIELMQAESSIKLQVLRADGGAIGNSRLMQFQADMLQAAVVTSEFPELSAMGAVFLGGLGVGFWSSLAEIEGLLSQPQVYEPAMAPELSEQYYQGWKHAVSSVLTSNTKENVS